MDKQTFKVPQRRSAAREGNGTNSQLIASITLIVMLLIAALFGYHLQVGRGGIDFFPPAIEPHSVTQQISNA